MKKYGLLILVLCAGMAHAGEYAYMVFTNTAGTTTALKTDGLTMTVDGSNLQVTNTEGTVQFVLTDLASMQFSTSEEPSGVENVLDANAPVRVFSLTGASLGSFGSLIEAAESLGTGAYVVSNGSATQKWVVR